MIVILWFSAPSLLSRLIRWITRSPYSHVAIMLYDLDPSHSVLYEGLGRGVVKLEGDDCLRRFDEAVATKGLQADSKDLEQVRAWLDFQVGRSYSLTGLITSGLTSVGLPAPIVALNGEYVCSGLVATALSIAGHFNPRFDPRLETPGSLAVRLEAVDR